MTPRTLISSSLTTALLAVTPSAQQDAQLFDGPVLAVPDSAQRMNRLLDLNNDGWTDAVGVFSKNDDSGGVHGFLNDGTGKLEPLFTYEWTQYITLEMPNPIEVADLNGDGLDDFVTGLRDEILVFLSNGAAAPTFVNDFSVGSGFEVYDLELGDYDGDGQLEIAGRMYKPSSQDKGIRIFEGLPTGPLTIAQDITVPAGTGFLMKNADVLPGTGDDLMCVGDTNVDLYGIQAGTLSLIATYPHGLTNIAGAESGDVDGDGDTDIVVFSMDGEYTILRRADPTTYVIEPPTVGGPATGLADVDGDGDLDGVCCGGGGGTTWFTNSSVSWFEISINDGTGGFDPAFRLLGMGANEIAGVADLDHDGDNDLVAGRVVYYNKGGIKPVTYGVGSDWLIEEAIHDFDNDGDADFGHYALYDQFERNRGDGVLEVADRVAPDPPAGTYWNIPGYFGDVDGDGDIDTVVHEKATDDTVIGQRLLLNTGGGGLAMGPLITDPGVLFHSDAYSHRVTFHDVTGDGRADAIASVPYVAEGTWVFVQGADGIFTETAHFAGEFTAACADFDGDGSKDLAMVDGDGMFLRFGDPSGLLTTTIDFAAPFGTFGFSTDLAIGDLDDDGDLDVVGPVHVEGEPTLKHLRILENLGSRNFAVHDDKLSDYFGLAYPIYVTDVNGDGSTDVLCGYREDDDGNSLFGMSTYLGSPAPGLDFTSTGAETYPIFWSMADFDGDGDLDGAANYEVVMNRAIEGPDAGTKVQYGAATAGQGGQEPTLGADGPILDNSLVTLKVSGAAPNAIGFLAVGAGTGQVPFGTTGGNVNILPVIALFPIAFPSFTAEWGSGAIDMPVWVPDGVGGLTFTHQVVVVDPSAQGGATVTNALLFTYGQG